MKRSLALVLALVLGTLCARADALDDQYVRIYNLIQEADLLNSNGQINQSLSKYLEAQNALQKFHRINPDWNPKVVNFRLTYLNTKVAAASSQPISADKSAKTAVATANSTNSALSAQLEHQLNSLKDQVHQLQSEKIILESKLKESFAAQPATIDPRELSKTQDQVKSLQKENDLLKVTVGQQKVRLATTYDAKAFEQTKQALNDANRKLAEQTDKASTLAQEKAALQKKVDTMAPSEWNASALEATKKALEDANRQLADQRQLSTKLASEKESLQSRLKGMTVDNETLVALKAENEVLKKQVADLRGGQSDATTKLAQAQAEIASLRSDKEVLRLEKITLESRVKQLLAAPAVAANPTPPENKQDAAKVKQLQQEKDDLQQKLDAANKELASRNKKGDSSRVLEMENQIAALRARLEVFEARQVPYTPEELALFQRPEMNLTEATVKSAKKSVKDLPPGSAALVVQAQRDFAAHDMDKAEAKYLQVLRQDEKNGAVLANLAAIQLEMNRLDEAEKHIKQALATDPEDSYSLSILGYLKFRQEKYDDALDALSRAAKLDPQNAQIQNYLGITLGQKGMRGAAETALRKAIQIEPTHASAHHNLAVIYLTQKPPLIELAKWHYQKALANGHPRNSDLEKMLDDQKIAANKP
jgi:Putative Zn-dependent protease, contains TPR repeats